MLLVTTFSDLNLLAVLAAGIAHMAANLLWFMPKLFGNAWTELTGREMKATPRWMAVGFVGHQVIALVLAVIVNLAQATGVGGGIVVGVLVWLGFVVTLELGELIWEKIPFKLFMIRAGAHLVALSLAGSILAVWR